MAEIPLFCSSFLDPRTIGRSAGALAASLAPRKARYKPINCIESSSFPASPPLEVISTNVRSDGSVVFRFGVAEEIAEDEATDSLAVDFLESEREEEELRSADATNLGIPVGGFPALIGGSDGEISAEEEISRLTGGEVDQVESSVTSGEGIENLSPVEGVESDSNGAERGLNGNIREEMSAPSSSPKLEIEAADASLEEIPAQMEVNLEDAGESKIVDRDGGEETEKPIPAEGGSEPEVTEGNLESQSDDQEILVPEVEDERKESVAASVEVLQELEEVEEDEQDPGVSPKDLEKSLVERENISEVAQVLEELEVGNDEREIAISEVAQVDEEIQEDAENVQEDDENVAAKSEVENVLLIDAATEKDEVEEHPVFDHVDKLITRDEVNPSEDEIKHDADMEQMFCKSELQSTEIKQAVDMENDNDDEQELPIDDDYDDEIITPFNSASEISNLEDVTKEEVQEHPIDDRGDEITTVGDIKPSEDEIKHDADMENMFEDEIVTHDDTNPLEDNAIHDADIEQMENLKLSDVDLVPVPVEEIDDASAALQNEITEPSSTQPRYVLSSGVAMLPHPSKVSTGGEDGYFLAGDNWLGVADGVGQWTFEGIDAGVFARELMNNCRRLALERQGDPDYFPTRVLSESALDSLSPGSSTALVACFDGQTLYVANIGDSGFVIVRNGRIFERSTPMVHGFNYPHQLEGGYDPSQFIQTYEVELEEGDVVVTGTDGLFDNLYDQEIIAIVSRCLHDRSSPTEMAERLAERAQHVGGSPTVRSPFADAAHAVGFSFFSGGKLDDVTVIVSRVLPSEIP